MERNYVDAQGAVYITGSTNTTDYPTTPDAPQTFYGSGSSDAIVSKVSFAASPPPPGGLPSPWTSQDVALLSSQAAPAITRVSSR